MLAARLRRRLAEQVGPARLTDPVGRLLFVRNSRGSRNNIIMFNGADITRLFDGHIGLEATLIKNIGLEAVLIKKVDAAEQEGRSLREL